MSCSFVRRRLSAYVESDLAAGQLKIVGAHLRECRECASHHLTLRRTMELVGEMPRLSARESLVSRVLDRLEAERRGPGLLVFRTFRTFWAARPLILPSLVPAVLVLMTVLSGALLLDGGRERSGSSFTGAGWDPKSEESGTESNPLFPSADVGLPQALGTRVLGVAMGATGGEGTLFLETVIARNGTVSAVTLLGGDSREARPIVDALRRERFEPVRLNGRRVAVSVYRLISRLEVRAPLT
jgi:Putative zinc-finger